MRRLFFHILFLCSLFLLNGHLLFAHKAIDSLESKLSKSNEADKISIFNKLAREYLEFNPEKAIYYGKLALKLENKFGHFSDKPASFNVIGDGYKALGNNIEALNFFHKAHLSAEKFGKKTDKAISLNNIGVIYRLFGQYSKALEAHLKALQFFTEINDKKEIAGTLNKCGIIYRNQNQQNKALECFQNALKISKEIKDNEVLAFTFLNIGTYYWYSKTYILALENYKKSLAIYELLGDKGQISGLLNNIGNVNRELENTKVAFDFFRRSLVLALEINNKNQIAVTYRNIGKTFFNINIYDSALNYFQISLNMSIEENLKRYIQDDYLSISDVYEKIGNKDKVIEYLKLYDASRDKIIDDEKTQSVIDLQYQFDIELKEKEIQGLQLNKTEIILNVIFIFSLVLIFLAFALYRLYINKKKYAVLLEREVKERVATEDLLSKSEEKFRTLADFLPEAIYESDVNGVLTYVNSTGIKLFGYSADDIERGISVLDMLAPDDKVRALQNRAKTTSELRSSRIEYKARKRDGTEFPVLIHTSAILSGENVIGTRGLVIDISERKEIEEEKNKLLTQAEALNKELVLSQDELRMAYDLTIKLNENLANSEANLKAMFDSTLQAYALISSDCKFLSFNKASQDLALNVVGKKLQIGDLATEIFPEFILGNFLNSIEKSMKGEAIRFENFYNIDSKLYWFDVSYQPAYDNQNNIVGVSFSLLDITERKKYENALRESEEKYRRLIEQAADAIIVGDLNGNINEVNSVGCELTGFTKDEILSMNLSELFTDEVLEKTPLRYDLIKKGETVFNEIILTTKTGLKIPIEMNTKIMSDKTCLAFIRDVRERKKSENALRESQRSLATLMSNLPGMAYRCLNDKDWTMIIASEGCLELTGYSAEDFTISKKVTFSELIQVDDSERVWNDVQAALNEKSIFRLIYRIKTANGDVKWVWEQGCGIYDSEETLVAFEGFIIDITETKLMENALVKSEERLQFALEAANDGLWDFNPMSNFMNYLSPRFYSMLGYKPQEFLIDFQKLLELTHHDDRELLKNSFRDYVKKINPAFSIEIRMRTKDGSYIWIYSRGKAVEWDNNSNITRIVGTHVDITERKIAEEILLESEKRFRAAFENVNYGNVITSLNGRFMKCNNAFCKMLGYSFEELTNFSFNDITHIDDRHLSDDVIRGMISGVKEYEILEKRYIRKNGSVILVRLDITLVRGINNQPLYYITHVQDITERKKAQDELRESEEKFRLLAEKTSDIIFTMDTDLNITYLNPAVLRHLGYTIDEYIDLPFSKRFPKESQKDAAAIFEDELYKIHKGIIPGKNYSVVHELRHLHKNRSIMWGEVNLTFLFDDTGKVYGIHGVIRNITERKKVEEAMRKSEERLKLALDAANDGLWDYNPKMNAVNYFSPRWYTMLGFEPYEFPMEYSYWMQQVFEEDKEKVQSAFSNYLSGEESVFAVEFRMKTKDKKLKWILSRGKFVETDVQGVITRMIGTHIDISERKEAEEALKKSQSKYMELTEFLPLSIYEADINGNIIFANRKAFLTFGYTYEDFVKGVNISQLVDEQDLPRVQANIPKIFSEKKSAASDYLLKRKDGSVFPAVVFSTVISQNDTVIGLRGTIVDITDRKLTEQQLTLAKEKAEESHRLKSAFLANMSHEIRTPMNAILGFTELLKSSDLTEDKRINFIDIISKRGKDLLNIINDIIDISKIESRQLKINNVKCYLNSVLYDLHDFFENDIIVKEKKKVKLSLKTALPDNECFILADDMRLKQVITNLIGNAIKFTSTGVIEFGYTLNPIGKLNRYMDTNEMGEPVEWNEPLMPELEFYVKDTGIGIAHDKLAIIFDRFRQADDSTSRHFGGTGLGLAISKSLVEMMGGEIFVESVEGKGSQFTFTIPYKPVTSLVETEPEKQIQERKSWSNKTILIVEDDRVNFLYLATILKKTKVRILHAANGLEAVSCCKKNQDIDLVLMDVQMPVMNGYESTRLIKQSRKDLPVIAQTAYALDEDKQRCKEAGCDEFIAKPIKIETLLSLIEKYFQ